MLAALHESVTAQRQLVADASHELRTPLTSLRAALGLTLAETWLATLAVPVASGVGAYRWARWAANRVPRFDPTAEHPSTDTSIGRGETGVFSRSDGANVG
jgi:signal transduction histidine kinase